MSEKVMQQIAIKKLIPRNFAEEQKGNVQGQKISIPFVGIKMQRDKPNQTLQVMMNDAKDMLVIQSNDRLVAFTENDVFEGLEFRKTSNDELQNYIKPQHLKVLERALKDYQLLENSKAHNNQSNSPQKANLLSMFRKSGALVKSEKEGAQADQSQQHKF